MIDPEEKKQILDGLSVLDDLFNNLEFLVYELDDKIRDGVTVPSMSEIIDALNRSIGTLRLTLDYIKDNLTDSGIKNTLAFYRTWISYLNRTISVSYGDDNLERLIFSVTFDVINDLYRSFKEFKKQVEDTLSQPITQQSDLNPPIPTKEL